MRVDQADRSFEPGAAKVSQDRAAGRRFARARTDHRDRARRKQLVEAIRRHWSNQFKEMLWLSKLTPDESARALANRWRIMLPNNAVLSPNGHRRPELPPCFRRQRELLLSRFLKMSFPKDALVRRLR